MSVSGSAAARRTTFASPLSAWLAWRPTGVVCGRTVPEDEPRGRPRLVRVLGGAPAHTAARRRRHPCDAVHPAKRRRVPGVHPVLAEIGIEPISGFLTHTPPSTHGPPSSSLLAVAFKVVDDVGIEQAGDFMSGLERQADTLRLVRPLLRRHRRSSRCSLYDEDSFS